MNTCRKRNTPTVLQVLPSVGSDINGRMQLAAASSQVVMKLLHGMEAITEQIPSSTCKHLPREQAMTNVEIIPIVELIIGIWIKKWVSRT